MRYALATFSSTLTAAINHKDAIKIEVSDEESQDHPLLMLVVTNGSK